MRAQVLATEPSTPEVGRSLFGASVGGDDSWHDVTVLARGGTAEVWRAIDRDGREVALKLPTMGLRGDPRTRRLLRREFECLQTAPPGSFVAPLEFTERRDVPVLVLEYLPGGDLVSLTGGPRAAWLPAFAAVLQGIGALHRKGIAHGDLKPRNVLFATDGSPRIIDLMTARSVDAPAPSATRAYAPADRSRVTARAADSFALAALLYELVTGRLPFGALGQGAPGEMPAAAAAAQGPAALLIAAASATLASGGKSGLSPLIDVIESVHAE